VEPAVPAPPVVPPAERVFGAGAEEQAARAVARVMVAARVRGVM
jgi:LDH2 family malate/lactate/ureidoglycolate dehydrogenase